MKPLNDRQLRILEVIVIVAFSCFPMLFSLPFRIHLDLPYEGAYRMYLGQMPFKDFKMPLGYGYLIILWLFFKVFGPYIFTLIYAQIFINLVAAFTFRGMLKLLNVRPVHILLATFVFVIAYNFIYFWPWYNQTALMFQMVGLFFLLNAIQKEKTGWKHILNLFFAGAFTFLTFFTKQDYGGLAFVFCLVLLAYNAWLEKKFLPLMWFTGFFAFWAALIILPLLPHEFGYWFNYGQAPHEKRVSTIPILNEFFSANSAWEKFYLLAIVLVLFNNTGNFKTFIKDKTQVLFTLITLGMVAEALITKVTSKHTSDNTTYFQGFAVAYLVSHLNLRFELAKIPNLLTVMGLIFLWWSAMYWKYAGRILGSPAPTTTEVAKPVPTINWVQTPFRSFRKITLPDSTIAGIGRIKNLLVVKNKKDLRVLNLTELTMLAYEIPFTPEKNLPLWYHNSIGIFPKQVAEICQEIEKKEYDVILYEDVSTLREFFAPPLWECAKKHYILKDKFFGPRKENDGIADVYVYVKE
ncbi:MAG: hypothetical protein H7Y04_13000 [Verrucomicrobia bacterium]|nr:hypothetical protein [Cytophagales bacterium]